MSYSEKLLDEIQKHNFSNNNILLKKALQNDDNNVLIDLAENLLGFGFTDLAKTVYMHLIKTFPDEGVFKVYLAEILLNDGDVTKDYNYYMILNLIVVVILKAY